MLNVRRRLIPIKQSYFLKTTTSCLHNNNKNSNENNYDDRNEYKRKTPHEHVILRPDMYVGQMEPHITDIWIPNSDFSMKERRFLVKKSLKYSAALLKLFDEILVNAADNFQRDPKMTYIDVNINTEESMPIITIENDGEGIPIELDERENLYIPELIFGNLLTGSNFDDTKNRIVGGRHGYGAKLTNILSEQFEIELYNSKKNLYYYQKWTNNMKIKHIPEISKHSKILTKKNNDFNNNHNDYTCIRFIPELNRFNTSINKNNEIDHEIFLNDKKDNANIQAAFDDIIQVMKRRTMDIAACIAPIQVYFNNENIKFDSFYDYVKLFNTINETMSNSDSTLKIKNGNHEVTESSIHDITKNLDTDNITKKEMDKRYNKDKNKNSINSYSHTLSEVEFIFSKPLLKRWHIAIKYSPSNNFEHVSYVNNIWTSRGGTHVTFISNQITKAIEEYLLKKKNIKVNSTFIKNKLFLFINSFIDNPSFDSQTKDALTTKPQHFGSNPILPKTFIRDIISSSNIISNIVLEYEKKERSRLNKTLLKNKSHTKSLIVPKLEDAHYAGKDNINALNCSLIITEGDSAKALAVAGLEKAGREYYGVLPLRGKILNVIDVSPQQLLNNAELVGLCRTLGLDFSKTYEQTLNDQGLRYGKLILMMDQDLDGSHIKGLIINLFNTFWPALIYKHNFIEQFRTPLVKVRYNDSSKKSNINKIDFFSIIEFEKWKLDRNMILDKLSKKYTCPNNLSYSVKYYKGLGTSTSEEGKEYFKNLNKYLKRFYPTNKTNELIDLAFNRNRSSDRKEWIINTFDPKKFINSSEQNMSYDDFINTELVQFSHADTVRSIPNIIDGLKPTQRKVLYSCFKKKLNDDIKVVQLSGYIAEQTAYHHGDFALNTTLINMAQDFVGSNNIPLLVPSGQFGTRTVGGKDYASPRYIFTRLSPFSRLLFPEVDDKLLDYLEEDGIMVEPKFYVPIIPTILLNGSQGVGTGWSTFIPSYRPSIIINEVEKFINNIENHKENLSNKLPLFKPWVSGFKGSITGESSKFFLHGIINRISNTEVQIDEIPAGRWTDDYKQGLFKMIERGLIRSFTEHHSSKHVCFLVKFRVNDLDKIVSSHGGLMQFFGLHRQMALSNMHAFNIDGKIQKYLCPSEVILEHGQVRFELYNKRRKMLIQKAKYDEAKNRNRMNFVKYILNGDLNLTLFQNSQYDLENKLKNLGFLTKNQLLNFLKDDLYNNNNIINNDNAMNVNQFDYLLKMPFQSLTEHNAYIMEQSAMNSRSILIDLNNTNAQKLWYKDLNSLKNPLIEFEEENDLEFK